MKHQLSKTHQFLRDLLHLDRQMPTDMIQSMTQCMR